MRVRTVRARRGGWRGVGTCSGRGRCLALAAVALAACGGHEAPRTTTAEGTVVAAPAAAVPDPALDSARLADHAHADSVARKQERERQRADSVRLDRVRLDSLRAMRDPRRIRLAALAAPGLRVAVSLDARQLLVLDGADTLRVAPVGIGMDSTLAFEGRVWNFRTPRGLRRVLGKTADPTWIPPEWHYVEVAHARGLPVVRLPAGGAPHALDDGSRIVARGDTVGLERPGEPWTPFAADEEVIWEGVLYVPPVGTVQRRVPGALGRYRLDLGNGYLMHGTPFPESVGRPSSHGCMRLGDDDIAWLYEHVPVGTPVYTY